MSLKWISCMFHIPLSEYDYIQDTLLNYDIAGYFIGHESTPYSHFHILFEGTNKIYNAFSRILVEKYDLRGKATVGLARQYGRIKQIRDIERMKQYTVKDGNVRSNIPQETLDEYMKSSFKVQDIRSMQICISDELDDLSDFSNYITKENDKYDNYLISKIKKKIIEISLEKKYKLTKSALNNFVGYYLTYSKIINRSTKIFLLNQLLLN